MSAEDPLMDLDVRNYDYPELLSLFQIQLSDPNKVEVLSSTENRSKVDNKMHVIEDIVDDTEHFPIVAHRIRQAQICQPIGRQLGVLIGEVAIIILAADDADVTAHRQVRQFFEIAAGL